MKALILSDIHSNIYALEAIWSKENDSDVIYITGDLVDYGPYPRDVIDWIRTHKAQCTLGNHDHWLVENYRAGNLYHKIPQDSRFWVHHNASLLDDAHINFLESLPKNISFDLNGIDYGLTHLYHEYDEITSIHAFEEFRRCSFATTARPNFSRLILGHTHRLCIHYLSDELLWLNPGSVSYRRRDDPDQSAHYATITDGKISLKRIGYDITPLQQDIRHVILKESEMQVAAWFFGPR